MSIPSVIEKYHSLPNVKPRPIENIKRISHIHIYDFDNTLFNSPAPNPDIITEPSLKILSYPYHMRTGGWWCQPSYLEALVDEWLADRKHLLTLSEDSSKNKKQEHEHNDDDEDCQCDECKIDGKYWNPKTCRLLQESSRRGNDTLTVIMTGRRSDRFATVMEKILSHTVFKKKIVVNAVLLKDPQFDSTMAYKTQVLRDLIFFFKPSNLVMYDDRYPQICGFKSFLFDFCKVNKRLIPPLSYDIILVPKTVRYLPAYKERLLLEKEIAEHNEIIKKQALLELSHLKNTAEEEATETMLKEIAFNGLEIKDNNIKAYYFLPSSYKRAMVEKATKLVKALSVDLEKFVFDPIGIRVPKTCTTEEFCQHLTLTNTHVGQDVPNSCRMKSLTDSSNFFYTTGYEESVKWSLKKLVVKKDLSFMYYFCELVTPQPNIDMKAIFPGLIMATSEAYMRYLPINAEVLLTNGEIEDENNSYIIDLDANDSSNTIITHFGYTFEVNVSQSQKTQKL